jgi:hypothetical protein
MAATNRSTGKPDLSVVSDKPTFTGGVDPDEVDAMVKARVDAMVKAEESNAVALSVFNREELADIESFDDAMKLAVKQFGNVILAHEDKNLGSGFRLTSDEDKYKLIGVPLILLDWRFNPGEFGDDFGSITAVAQGEDGKSNKLIINDGGTGICKDLKEYTQKTNRMGGLLCRRGLRVSEYDTDLDSGKPISKMTVMEYHRDGKKTGRGKTFYLDFSA